ncbi:MAG TPA: 4Fe-4S single cluster domain-containing protein [Anaeromyxobacteraceae bacterium]|nr:4Fe-4S single cluster domain-containing protein [Anaeromyxobacteraceae bacterium]
MALRIARVVPVTEAEGPGRRLAVWVQGCRIRCPGCCNPGMLDRTGGRATSPAALAARIRRVRGRIEGVTLLGGEPFDQSAPLAEVARACRGMGLSVTVFTGYTLERLRARRDRGARALLSLTDLLVDGPYDPARPERARRWVGSANQRFHFLTGRYRPGVESVAPGEPAETVEVTIGPGGRVAFTGWPVL